MPPDKEEPYADLEKEERHQQRLHDLVAVIVAEHFHHRVVRFCPGGNIKWLALWSAKKIMTRASTDRPWPAPWRGGCSGFGRLTGSSSAESVPIRSPVAAYGRS
jgi:hypothetical protein